MNFYHRRVFLKRMALSQMKNNYACIVFLTFLFVISVIGLDLFFDFLKDSCRFLFADFQMPLLFFSFDIFSFVILCPLILGYISTVCSVQNINENIVVLSLCARDFKHKLQKYLKTGVFSIFCFIVTAMFLPTVTRVFNLLVSMYFSSESYYLPVVRLFASILFIFLLYRILIYFSGFLLVHRLYTCERSFLSVLKMSRRYMKSHRREFVFDMISFLPLFVISAVSFGTVFIFFTLPYFIFYISSYSSYVISSENLEENNKSINHERMT